SASFAFRTRSTYHSEKPFSRGRSFSAMCSNPRGDEMKRVAYAGSPRKSTPLPVRGEAGGEAGSRARSDVLGRARGRGRRRNQPGGDLEQRPPSDGELTFTQPLPAYL